MIIQSIFEKCNKYTAVREGEVKFGQVIAVNNTNLSHLDELQSLIKTYSAPYVLLGIPEDIGVRANMGKAGARHAFDAFLSYFVNIQQNEYTSPSDIYLLGEIYVDDLVGVSDTTDDIHTLRQLTAEVDERVFGVIQTIVRCGKIPIVIGGGHNNAYGIIKGVSLALNQKINVINIDPHADFRIEEGRHSGNGFRYAYVQGFLSRYGVYGWHENYNNHVIIEAIKNHEDLMVVSYDDIWRRRACSFSEFLQSFEASVGLEIDLDSIRNMPTSAVTPVGFSEEEILRMIFEIGNRKEVHYYHLTEGAPDEKNRFQIGKFLSYAVSEILKTKMLK